MTSPRIWPSTWDDLYDEHARERVLEEPVKRVPAPERTPFERDRARVVHSAALRRLAAKTQVVGPQSDDFVRNRLTHSLEVAQIARDLARPIGCHPDLAETAALAHDLGHPPFGHNGERALAELAVDCGGFEGNAQTLRLLTRLEAKTAGPDGRSLGLNLTRATLDACTKYPWGPQVGAKFGVYDEDRDVFAWVRKGVAGDRRCVEAQVMDVADDVAYSVHDLEDGVVAGRIDLALLADPAALDGVWEIARAWYVPGVADDELQAALSELRRLAVWPNDYDGTRRSLAALKNLTSDLIGIFCGSVQAATHDRFGERRLIRHEADLVVPAETALQIAVLKAVAAYYVMQTADRVALMVRQRDLLHELDSALLDRPDQLDPPFAEDFADARDDAGRHRVVLDQIASLTDASAVTRHGRLEDG